MSHGFFPLHFPMDSHLGCFQILATMKKTAPIVHVRVFTDICPPSYRGESGSRVAGSSGSCVLGLSSFLMNLLLVGSHCQNADFHFLPKTLPKEFSPWICVLFCVGASACWADLNNILPTQNVSGSHPSPLLTSWKWFFWCNMLLWKSQVSSIFPCFPTICLLASRFEEVFLCL